MPWRTLQVRQLIQLSFIHILFHLSFIDLLIHLSSFFIVIANLDIEPNASEPVAHPYTTQQAETAFRQPDGEDNTDLINSSEQLSYKFSMTTKILLHVD